MVLRAIGKLPKLLVILLGGLFAYVVIAFSLEFSKAKRQASHDERTLETVLTNRGIAEVKIVNEEAGTENILTNEAAQAVMAMFAATNRIPWSGPMFLKLYFAGYVRFHNTEKSQAWTVSYLPHYDAATYGEYYFRLKGSNDLRNFFQSPLTNNTHAALPP